MSAREAPGTSIADPKTKELDGLQLLKQIRVIDQAVPVIIVAGTHKTQEAVEVLKVGDFVRFEHLATWRSWSPRTSRALSPDCRSSTRGFGSGTRP